MKYSWENKLEKISASRVEYCVALKVPPLIAGILVNRDIDTYEKAKSFFRPHFKQLHDPYLMQDMDLAVKRLIKALTEGESIFVYGDYDVDGVTGTTILYKGIRQLGGKVSFFIPERQKDGYGLSDSGVRTVRRKGAQLILTVDCGISAVDEARLIDELGMDLIICDHHRPGDILPEAIAVLDPKRVDNEYPFTELAGCGVAFKLMQALYTKLGEPFHKLIDLLEFVAIGSSADIVPLIDENRVLTKFGLEKINTQPGIGVQALLEVSRMQYREITPSQIVFFLAPRINAVGRMGDASKAVHMFISSDQKYSQKISRFMEEENKLRRSIDEVTFADADQLVENSEDLKSRNGLALYKENWHIGVIGIVASRLVEKYHRPVAMLSVHDGVGKGSVRSTAGIDVYAALEKCAHLVIEFGGHKFAAGVTVKEDKLEEFANCFNQAIAEVYPEIKKASLEIESDIKLSEIDAEVLKFLKMMRPYGPGNMRPVFMTNGVCIRGKIRILNDKHLKFKVKQDSITIDCIYFNSAEEIDHIESIKENMNIAFSIEENTWNGTTTIQLRIRDIR